MLSRHVAPSIVSFGFRAPPSDNCPANHCNHDKKDHCRAGPSREIKKLSKSDTNRHRENENQPRFDLIDTVVHDLQFVPISIMAVNFSL